MRAALTPRSLRPWRDAERTSMRLPESASATRTTMSSVKPIQKLCTLASMRRAVGSASTIVQLIFFAVASAIGLAFAQLNNSDKGRGIVGVRRDVVDRGHAACQGAIMPGHIGGEAARCQGEDRDRNLAPADRRAVKDANNKGGHRKNNRGDDATARVATQ